MVREQWPTHSGAPVPAAGSDSRGEGSPSHVGVSEVRGYFIGVLLTRVGGFPPKLGGALLGSFLIRESYYWGVYTNWGPNFREPPCRKSIGSCPGRNMSKLCGMG